MILQSHTSNNFAKIVRQTILFSVLLYVNLFSQEVLSAPRSPAEWEEISGLVMEERIYDLRPTFSWDKIIDPYLKGVAVALAEGIDFYLIRPGTIEGEPNMFRLDTAFARRGISSPLIHFIDVPSEENFPWTRDNGPFFVYDNKVGDRTVIGFPGDESAKTIAEYLHLPFIQIPSQSDEHKYYFDGGNWLTDGHGTFNIASVSDSKLEVGLENPATHIFNYYFGIGKTLNLGGIYEHTDFWLKMIDEETFLIAEIPDTNYLHICDPYRLYQRDITAGIELIRGQLKSVFGRDFRFIPITNAPSAEYLGTQYIRKTAASSYVNSLILNNHVLVPQYNCQPYDSLALRTYREAMPGYKIVGVNCELYAIGSGAIHCLTREIYAENPIYIKHPILQDTVNTSSDFEISCEAESNDGIKGVSLFWRKHTEPLFAEIKMSRISTEYYAFIPKQPNGIEIDYYIEAENNNGKIITKPFVAPNGYYSFVGIDSLSLNAEESLEVPTDFRLSQNYPNPFNPETTIEYSLPLSGKVSLKIFNALGEEVISLIDGVQSSGRKKTTWNGKDSFGQECSSGFYIAVLTSGGKKLSRKMQLIR